MEKYIPNLDTHSTLVDRLTVENVKLATFEHRLEISSKDLTLQRDDLHFKIDTQKEIIENLKKKMTDHLLDIFSKMEYEFFEEKRTFKT